MALVGSLPRNKGGWDSRYSLPFVEVLRPNHNPHNPHKFPMVLRLPSTRRLDEALVDVRREVPPSLAYAPRTFLGQLVVFVLVQEDD